ncbi:MAG TPA: alkaline phosphatase family protein [Xanthobacteraceae bacterium]|nr:alkaline phosphatase family protein [Xanthobacteraceae bacterium]
MRLRLKSCTALTAAALVLPPAALASGLRGVTAQPSVPVDMASVFVAPDDDPPIAPAQMTELLRRKIKYVFVIFNENHSFDNEFGTFPGVNGIYSDGYKDGIDQVRAPADTPGFTQTVNDADAGIGYKVTPFRIGPLQGASAVDSVDHQHAALAAKIDVGADNIAAMDGFAQDEYDNHTRRGVVNPPGPIATGVQYSRLVMSHIDCDTIPFFWNWANHFTIFDNIFATEDTPSTPNAIAMIAGQSGETQWVKHATDPKDFADAHNYPAGVVPAGVFAGQSYAAGTTIGVPLIKDEQPFYGSQLDRTGGNARQPASRPDDYFSPNQPVATNLTFATLPLTFMGRRIAAELAGNLSDGNPKSDLADIQHDIAHIAARNDPPVHWGWYQEGYGFERTDALGEISPGDGRVFVGTGTASHNSYVFHHNGPAYFGYVANTPGVANQHLRGLDDFFHDIDNDKFRDGGVFYIRGGFLNQQHLLSPVGTNPSLTKDDIAWVQAAKNGDDDHPAYSDRQLAEAMMAKVINAIAGNPRLWSQSAIIITYDESDGFYDHVPPRVMSYGPDRKVLSRGIRVPLLLISPYARGHAVAHAEGDHNAIIETINAIFGLPALASLPDEKEALEKGNSPGFNALGPAGFKQEHLGPRDIPSEITDNLLSGFSPKRLRGEAPLLPARLAMIDPHIVRTLPHYGGDGCNAIGMVPEDWRQGIRSVVPGPVTFTVKGGATVDVKGFNALPQTLPERN